MTQPIIREYKTAEEALEAANHHMEAAIEEINRRAFPARQFPIIQFAVRKPEPHHNWPETLKPNWNHPPIIASIESEE